MGAVAFSMTVSVSHAMLRKSCPRGNIAAGANGAVGTALPLSTINAAMIK